MDTQDATLRDVTWGFAVGEDDSHSSAFVGFDGTIGEGRLNSLRAILMDIDCQADVAVEEDVNNDDNNSTT